MRKEYNVEIHNHYHGYIGTGNYSGGGSSHDIDNSFPAMIATIVCGIVLSLIFGKWILVPYIVLAVIIALRDIIPSIIQTAIVVVLSLLGNWIAGDIGMIIAFVLGWIITSKIMEVIEDNFF